MRKKRSWFYRLVTTYLPIVYLLAFVLFFVFFMTISQLSQQQTVRANEAFTRYSMLQLSSILGNIDQNVNAEILNNREFNQYMFQLYDQDVNPYLLRSKIADRFRQIKAGFPFIQSIYFYRNADMSVLGTETYLPLAEFGDRAFVQEQQKQLLPNLWTSIRSYKQFDSQPFNIEVVSLVKKVPLLTEPSGILVVNFDVSELAAWLQSISEGSISSIKLADQTGRLIGQSKEQASRDIHSLKLETTGWTFYSGIKDTYHYGIFSELYYSWIVIGILMVLVASAGIIYLSKRYARPIDASINRITEFLNGRLGSQPNEELVQYVDAAVDRVIDFANRYQTESNSNLPYKQKHFFNELLTGDRQIDNEELLEEIRQFGLFAKWLIFGTAHLEIDRIGDFSGDYSKRDQVLLKFVLTNVLKETAEQQGIGIWSEWVTGDKLGILFGAEEEIRQADISSICESARSWVETNLAFTVTIGIGTVIDRAEDIRVSYVQAVKAVQYRSALGNNRVIDYAGIARQTETELYDILQLIRTLVHSFKSGSESWSHEFRFLFTAIGRGLYTHDELKNLFYYMTFTFTRELSEFPAEYVDIWQQDALEPMTKALETFDSLEEIQRQYVVLLEGVAAKWKGMRTHRSQRNLMHQVKDYIKENYGNPDLSLQLLGEEFGINKSYLSRLFKDEIGENFVDFVTEVRIGNAKRLLEETDLPIQEIALRTGYVQYFSFNRAFKKKLGFPPSDFRRMQTPYKDGLEEDESTGAP
ncbi:helix-turn-helix domain-containing protein [Cohnella cellulosilytica]|uniref:Helix-turn-helix domain-containing protein n=1 Tax=Cohnella cellulosilytica TaxID=986710 RepID=A0ABW2FIW8_9BACL